MTKITVSRLMLIIGQNVRASLAPWKRVPGVVPIMMSVTASPSVKSPFRLMVTIVFIRRYMNTAVVCCIALEDANSPADAWYLLTSITIITI